MPVMMQTYFMCPEKNQEENLPVLKMALTRRYNDLKNTWDNVVEDRLQPQEQ